MFPIAMEGALKLKEISYIHAEGYAAGEMKHGPIALIDENMPVVVIANQGPLYDKLVSNLEQVRARDGRVIAVATEGNSELSEKANEVVYIPDLGEFLTSILAVIPLAIVGIPRRDIARDRRGPAPKPRQECDCGVAKEF